MSIMYVVYNDNAPWFKSKIVSAHENHRDALYHCSRRKLNKECVLSMNLEQFKWLVTCVKQGYIKGREKALQNIVTKNYLRKHKKLAVWYLNNDK